MAVTVNKRYAVKFTFRSYAVKFDNVVFTSSSGGNPIPVVIPSTIP